MFFFIVYFVEFWFYVICSCGIGIQQIFGKFVGFFFNNVNFIVIIFIGWCYLVIYCGWIVFEFIVIFFFYFEIFNCIFEEFVFMFEDEEFNNRIVVVVEKKIQFGDQEEFYSIDVYNKFEGYVLIREIV